MKRFSLVEVLVALALIVTVAATALRFVTDDTLASMQGREATWHRHLLVNIVEYHLAAGLDAQPPPELLPAGYRWELRRSAVTADELALPALAEASSSGLRLIRLDWLLLREGAEVDSLRMDRILPDTALEPAIAEGGP